MRHRSKKRAAQERQYLRDREVFLQHRPRCEMRLSGCTFWASEVHHQRGREGARLLEQEYWLPCCSGCHHFVTVNPAKAFDLGLSLHRNAVTP